MFGMNAVWIWLGIALVALVLEILTPSALVSIWFCVGALIGALLALCKTSFEIQIVGFFIVSIVSMLVVRPIASRYLRGNIVPTNADRMIGQVGTLTKSIEDGHWGEVYILSTYWSAISCSNEPIKKGSKVKVCSIEGAKLVVEPLHK
ncbi:NfeD family protein [Dubosiella newyorkensis]|uniref:NfeD family protein n=1 Tax=Dubosiella newyorkensis TaxID=1862672 RepID=UPI002354E737|nr:NfeD family protein [Dubosiella newyorkensis]MCI9041510.1 NfeD family protein [Dubosiella newyorkensis]